MRKVYWIVIFCVAVTILGTISCDRQKMMQKAMENPQAVAELVNSIMASGTATDKMLEMICADKTAAGKLMDRIVGDNTLSNEMIAKLLANPVTADQFMILAVQDAERAAKIKNLLKGK
ncbi:MAG: hypothetical protein V2A71_01215 [Candidatus Eisenbacteria bacterium]